MSQATITRARDRTHDKFQRLVETAQHQPPVVTAVAHPCDEVSLESAVEAAKLKLSADDWKRIDGLAS